MRFTNSPISTVIITLSLLTGTFTGSAFAQTYGNTSAPTYGNTSSQTYGTQRTCYKRILDPNKGWIRVKVTCPAYGK